mgnify:CR=1 FL=1
MFYSASDFEKFADNFDLRLKAHEILVISEDCLRYDFFGTLISQGCNTERCVLEFPHPHESFIGREIDFIQYDEESKPIAIIEMKYYKRIPSNKQDRTGHMAKLIVDLLKLSFAEFENVEKYFIMATDSVMKTYINNDKNGFSQLLSSKIEEKIKVSPSDKKGKITHFNKIINKDICKCLNPIAVSIEVQRVFEKDISKDHSIYIFKINS